MEPVQVRWGAPEDVETIAQYNLQLAWETEQLRLDWEVVRAGVQAVFEDPSRGRYLVAELDGNVVGQLMITTEWSDWRNGPMWWIQSVYVAQEHRGRGVFRALFQRLREEAQAASVRALRLYVEKENTTAQEVYRRLGMRPSGYLVYEMEPV
ncbi:MAG: hypothetical protein KatS3mg115_0186 [Candidatus Poribacteria bacterium]|nr:MAG: hypothetical protein KatS3mg115_0186 [Candidatus Poribacteria bacterium]